MIELQVPQQKVQSREPGDVDLQEIKSLEEYIQLARIPDMFGISSRVVKALQGRIGHSSLAMDGIADQLNHSIRTLQRRLQQQNTNFLELRDQVRFHYSIDCLVKRNMTIDAVSVYMDYSERTSFTTAFKRWSGLSPYTFRKLYREYT